MQRGERLNYDVLVGKSVLVAEDEYLIAEDLRLALIKVGAQVNGPHGAVASALRGCAAPPDAAVLDINLAGERVFPVAERLLAHGVPFVFTTGYDDLQLCLHVADEPCGRQAHGLRAAGVRGHVDVHGHLPDSVRRSR